MKQIYWILIIILLFGSCKKQYKGVVIYKDFDKKIFKQHHDSIRKYEDCLANPNIPKKRLDTYIYKYFKEYTFKYKVYKNDSLCFSEPEEVISFKQNDTLSLCINLGNGLISIYVHENNYILDMFFLTDIGGTYPDGNKQRNYLKPNIKSHKLILMKSDFSMGDTLYGYLEVITEPYKYNSFENGIKILNDSIYGYFASVIIEKDYYDRYLFFHVP